MSQTITTLVCPSCGGKLEITPDIERYTCQFCGNAHIIRRTGDSISLEPIVAKLDIAASSFDRNASELAITRLNAEIAELEPRTQKALAELEARRQTAIAAIEQRRHTIAESDTVKQLKSELAPIEQRMKSLSYKRREESLHLDLSRRIIGTLIGCVTFPVLLLPMFVVFDLAVSLVRDLIERITSTSIPLLVGHEGLWYAVYSATVLMALLIAACVAIAYSKNAVKKHRPMLQQFSTKQDELNREMAGVQLALDEEIAKNLRLAEAEAERQYQALKKQLQAERDAIEKPLRERQEQLAKHYKRVSL